MLILVTGGAASGKSEHAERLVCEKAQSRLYLATMQPFGKSAEARIARHRALRAGKGFATVERTLDLANLRLSRQYDGILLEDLGNLLANELFAPEGAGAGSAFDSIVAGVDNLQKYCETLVIVSNEIFADGVPYPPETMQYIRILGELHQKLTGKADAVYESVCGILLSAFSMYSAIPVPQVNWEKQTMRWALGFLPLIGVLIGAIEWFWFAFCTYFGANGVFYAVIAALIPMAVSGGIHLDGLCDTCDALCSFGDREKRLAILKDPHVGAFGPLWLMAFLLAEVGCFAQIYDRPVLLPLACTGFAFARAMGGRKVVASPCAKDSGLAHIFAENSDKRAVSRMLVAEFVLFAVLLGLWIYRVPHALAAAKVLVIVLVVWYAVHEHISRRVFGGVTGDLAGFCISLSELITLAAAAIGGLIL